jgi:hypothetical protein
MSQDQEAGALTELIQSEPEHLVVLPAQIGLQKWPAWLRSPPPVAYVLCHASIDDAGEYNLRPLAELVGPNQRLSFDQYVNPLVKFDRKET